MFMVRRGFSKLRFRVSLRLHLYDEVVWVCANRSFFFYSDWIGSPEKEAMRCKHFVRICPVSYVETINTAVSRYPYHLSRYDVPTPFSASASARIDRWMFVCTWNLNIWLDNCCVIEVAFEHACNIRIVKPNRCIYLYFRAQSEGTFRFENHHGEYKPKWSMQTLSLNLNLTNLWTDEYKP